MPTDLSQEPSNWIQWILGIWSTAVTGAVWFLYTKMDQTRAELRQDTGEKLETIIGEMRELKHNFEAERRIAAEDRTKIAEKVVTRAELDKQIDRLANEMDKQIQRLVKESEGRRRVE